MTRSISFGLGGKNLKDRDFFGVSDPYVTISRPSSSGGYVKIRTSETKMVNYLQYFDIILCKLFLTRILSILSGMIS